LSLDSREHTLSNFILHQNVDVVITPVAINMKERFSKSFESKTQPLNQTVTWFVFGSDSNFNAMKLFREK
jgi:hypothetical protein